MGNTATGEVHRCTPKVEVSACLGRGPCSPVLHTTLSTSWPYAINRGIGVPGRRVSKGDVLSSNEGARQCDDILGSATGLPWTPNPLPYHPYGQSCSTLLMKLDVMGQERTPPSSLCDLCSIAQWPKDDGPPIVVSSACGTCAPSL